MAVAEPELVVQQSPLRVPALDGVRGIAVLMILIFHFAKIPTDLVGPLGTFDQQWLKITFLGWTGVNLFFVLSGFLITNILLDLKGPTLHYFRTFYGRRALRIFPPFILLMMFLLVILPLTPGESAAAQTVRDNQIWLWLYLMNIKIYVDPGTFTLATHYVSHLWSLAVEEQFYLVWPFFVFLLGRKPLMVVALAVIIGAAVLRIWLLADGTPALLVYFFTPTRMDDLAFGALIALLARNQEMRRYMVMFAWPLAAVALAATIGIYIKLDGLIPFDPSFARVGYTVLGLLFAAVIAGLAFSPDSARASAFMSIPALRFFGKYSYAIYLIHLPLANFLARHTGLATVLPEVGGSVLPSVVVFAAVTTVATLTLALLSWRLVEQPIMALRSRLPQAPVPAG